jgi:hypothetical protein
MPVVTIEPALLDPIPFEREEKDRIDFTITNHGFIKADNLQFSLPTGHPTLHFVHHCFGYTCKYELKYQIY